MHSALKKRLSKPLPLKQRTSSIDARRDYNTATWWSVLGLLKLREYFITVDHFSIWRRHLAWAMEDGKNLRDYMTQRYASSMVFMSLLLSTELNVLFNSSPITTAMRLSLQKEEYWLISFWIGIMIITSAILTLLSLISTYTAWCMVSSVHETNAHCIFRSSIGQYVAELPGRLIVGSIYSFLAWLMMFLFVLLPVGFWSIALVGLSGMLFVHTICCFSAFGRIIMHSGSMAHQRVFEQSYERNLLPHSLHAHLLAKARANLSKNTSILRQYRSKARPIDHFDEDDEEAAGYLDGSNHAGYNESTPLTRASYGTQDYDHTSLHNEYPSSEPRSRADSTVRFADEVDVMASSPSKETLLRNRGNDSISPVPEGDTSLSQQSSTSPASTDSMTDESKSIKQEVVSKPPRPGIVRRDRSNTTANNDASISDIFEIRKRNPSPKPNRPPPQRSKVNRTESDSALQTSNNAMDWSHKRTSLNETKRSAPPVQTRSTGSLPQPWPPNNPPGLSVLENAAKLHLQWQNSRVSTGSDHGQAGDHRSPRSPFGDGSSQHSSASQRKSETNLQQLWVQSSPTITAAGRKQSKEGAAPRDHQRPTTLPTTTPYQSNNNYSEIRPSSTMSQSSSAGALSSQGGGGGSTTSGVLSEQEEEAYMRDYGSYEELSAERGDYLEDDRGDPPWQTNGTYTDTDTDTNTNITNEAASLLDYDRLVEDDPAAASAATSSYASLDDATPIQSGAGRKRAPPPPG